MKILNKKTLISSLVILGAAFGSTTAAFADSDEETTVESSTPAAEMDSQPALTPKYGTEGQMSILANSKRSVKSYTGGTLYSNTWLSSLHSGGLVDYQVSANYNKTDHKNIQTKWHATIQAYNTSTTASVTIGTTGGSISASTTKNSTTAKTGNKYYQNTKSQKDASYRSNLALKGNWEKVTLTNESSEWGNKVVKKAAINSQTTVKK